MKPVATSAKRKNIVDPSWAGGVIGTMSPEIHSPGLMSLLSPDGFATGGFWRLARRQMVQGCFLMMLRWNVSMLEYLLRLRRTWPLCSGDDPSFHGVE